MGFYGSLLEIVHQQTIEVLTRVDSESAVATLIEEILDENGSLIVENVGVAIDGTGDEGSGGNTTVLPPPVIVGLIKED